MAEEYTETCEMDEIGRHWSSLAPNSGRVVFTAKSATAYSSFAFLTRDTDVGMNDSKLGLYVSSNFYDFSVHMHFIAFLLYIGSRWLNGNDIFSMEIKWSEHPATPFPWKLICQECSFCSVFICDIVDV